MKVNASNNFIVFSMTAQIGVAEDQVVTIALEQLLQAINPKQVVQAGPTEPQA